MDSPGQVRTRQPVAAVMGASKGLGRAIAITLAKRGYRTILAARSGDLLGATVTDLNNAGAQACAVSVDFHERLAGEKIVRTALDQFGALDALVTNAGGPPAKLFEELTDDDWATAFEGTVMSAVRTVREAIPEIRKSEHGRIVLLGSTSVRMPIEGLTLSNALRPALAGLVKSLAVELAPSRVTVNMVCPGRFDTERAQEIDAGRARRAGVSREEMRSIGEGRIPAGRYGRPEELAGLVAYLMSDEADYVTGQAILMDGGLVPSLP